MTALVREGGGTVAAEASLTPLQAALSSSTLGVVSMAAEDWGSAGAGSEGGSSSSAEAGGAGAQWGEGVRDLQGLRRVTGALGLRVVDWMWIMDSIQEMQLKNTDAYDFP